MAPGIDKVKAGRRFIVSQLKVRDLKPSVPQRSKSQVRRYLSAHQQRLGAESWIVHYLQVVNVEPRPRKDAVFDLANLYLPAQSAAQRSRKAVAKANAIEVGREENCQYQQGNGSDDELLPADGFLPDSVHQVQGSAPARHADEVCSRIKERPNAFRNAPGLKVFRGLIQ